jgi:RNA polymerase sigma-70 factor (ECF subfamily)
MRGVNVSEHETLQRKQRYAEESDAELARRVAAGETAAFEFIMRRHNRALFHTARAILHNDAEAEDALQDAYLQAYRAIGTYRAEARLSTWLARIVANEAFMRLRKHARRCTILPLQPGVALEDIASSMGEDMDSQPELCAGRAEMRRLLESRIDALPDAYRVVFMLRAVDEYSVEETAAILQIPEPTVRSRFFRARSLLRARLACEIDIACADAFAFGGERCDRIVARVLQEISCQKETPCP